VKVREVIDLIEADGWYLVATRGQPPAVQAPDETGADDRGRTACRRLAAGNPEQHPETGGRVGPEKVSSMRYAVVIEKAASNYAAYVPDLPGCLATGATVEEVEAAIREAIRFHIDGLREDGLPIPQPTTMAEYVEA
jgi:predicted RNase H-like HicB family nuclease